ncbi:MAG: cell division protein ZapA [Lachnospiraceae bacterium]|nr:cell division protein ZapA [Lachnospiraceae bacterium]
MSSKTDTQVVIGGRMYTVSGYESEAYLQQVAAYLNNKLAEFDQMEGFHRQSIDLQHFLIQLNLADDYFQVKKQTEMLEAQLEEKEKELYDIKHELITTQMKLETTEGSVDQMKKELEDRDRRLIRMDAELKSIRH